ncbi:hypothetical protein TorRG33x02_213960 [Trema orientale]|uniref:Uncharacterized protein n=1 Tax=Trema orientale TaxID=63057 RepID=A0A2P5EBA0_TREOI|nr:hypothetical protein TorRG33x02_213960 [Trema orientale]
MKHRNHLLLGVNLLEQHRVNHVRKRVLVFEPFPDPPHEVRHLHRRRRGRRKLRRLAREQFEQDNAEGIDVPLLRWPATGHSGLGGLVVVGSLCLYGLQVRQGPADEAPGRGVVPGDADEPVEPEIGYVGLELVVEEDVGGFDVSMDELPRTALVEVGQASSCSFGDSEPCGP